jgi:RNA polymerase-binding transcription factor DksA
MPRASRGCDSGVMKHLTDDELRGARSRLLVRSAELQDRLGRIRQDLERRNNPPPQDLAEAVINVENDEILEGLQRATAYELERIGLAMQRIDAGSFAICERCGREIGAERLRVVPHATRCHDCEHEARVG